MASALDGITVLELVRKGPGAFVTMMLADMGANVIKIEAPGRGDEAESGGSPPKEHVRAQAARVANRGKRSLVLDLKQLQGKAILRELASRADVLVEGFRPGVTRRLGADYETLKALNPSLVYCSLSGYGQDGPYRDLPGHDVNYLAMGGVLNLIGESGRPPVVPPNVIADYGGAALHAVCGIMMALFARERCGRGQHVDIAYLDAALALMSASRFVYDFIRAGIRPRRGVGALSGQFPYYGVYATKDGKYLSVGCVEAALWRDFCRALGRPDLIEAGFRDGDFQGVASDGQSDCRKELAAIFATRDRDEWFVLLKTAGVAVGKVYEFEEIFHDPQLVHRKMIVSLDHPQVGEILQIGIPIKLSDTPGKVRGFAPWRGQHSVEILEALGYTEEQIAQLTRDDVI